MKTGAIKCSMFVCKKYQVSLAHGIVRFCDALSRVVEIIVYAHYIAKEQKQVSVIPLVYSKA